MEETEKEEIGIRGKITLEEGINRMVSNPDFQDGLKDLIYLRDVAEYSVREFNRAMEKFADSYPTIGGIIDLNLRMELITETQPETEKEESASAQ